MSRMSTDQPLWLTGFCLFKFQRFIRARGETIRPGAAARIGGAGSFHLLYHPFISPSTTSPPPSHHYFRCSTTKLDGAPWRRDREARARQRSVGHSSSSDHPTNTATFPPSITATHLRRPSASFSDQKTQQRRLPKKKKSFSDRFEPEHTAG